MAWKGKQRKQKRGRNSKGQNHKRQKRNETGEERGEEALLLPTSTPVPPKQGALAALTFNLFSRFFSHLFALYSAHAMQLYERAEREREGPVY